MIHVCFGLNDKDGRYSKFTGTAILSMFENHYQPPPSITVHLLHDNTLTQDNRDKFSYIVGRYGQIIKFYNVEEICADEIARIKKLFANDPALFWYSIAAMYRILTPHIFSEDIEKFIYLDSDVIVNLDINELWQIPLGDKILATVAENEEGLKSEDRFLLCHAGIVKPEDYFNSGVLLINLKQIRQTEMENIEAGIKFLAENPQYGYFDQDILNYCFSKKSLKLPRNFNFFIGRNRKRGNFQTEQRIIHYAGKSLGMDLHDNFNRLWFKYFVKTQWFNEEIIAHLDAEVKKDNAFAKNLAIKLSALIAEKSRAFFIPAPNIEMAKKIFLIRDDEEIIPIVNQESFQNLLTSMNNSRGKKVFFILFSEYERLCEGLIRFGFVEWQDFIDGLQFLSDETGVPMNTYKLVKAM